MLVLLGNGDGTFLDDERFRGRLYVTGLATVDLDGDGMLDVVVADGLNHEIVVLLNQW